MLCAEECGIDYEFVALNPLVGEHMQAEHLARHPLGKIPVLEDGSVTVFESMSIARYLIEKTSARLYGSGLEERAVIDQWSNLLVNHVGRGIGVLYLEQYIKPKFRRQETNGAAVAAALEQLKTELPILEKNLEGKRAFTGEDYSMADIVALSYFLGLKETSVSLDEYSSLSAWFKQAEARAATRKMLARFQPDSLEVTS